MAAYHIFALLRQKELERSRTKKVTDEKSDTAQSTQKQKKAPKSISMKRKR